MNWRFFPPPEQPQQPATPWQRFSRGSFIIVLLHLVISFGFWRAHTPAIYALIAAVLVVIALFVAATIFFAFFYNMVGIGMIVMCVIVCWALPERIGSTIGSAIAGYTWIFTWYRQRARHYQVTNVHRFIDDELRRFWGRA